MDAHANLQLRYTLTSHAIIIGHLCRYSTISSYRLSCAARSNVSLGTVSGVGT
jgi:hypothetical protein